MWPFGGGSPAFDPAKNIPDLKGKVILVTGGNNGIGRETCLRLAQHNPSKIFLAARSEIKGREAIEYLREQLNAESQHVDIEFLSLDLASLQSVQSAADQVNAHTQRLDILILNAGIMAVPPGETKDGFEIQLGTNHVGHFLLTRLLLPKLRYTAQELKADVRVVCLSSQASRHAPDMATILDPAALSKQSAFQRYGASKRANVLFAAECARRESCLTVVSIHPGTVKTDLFTPNRDNNWIMRVGILLIGPLVFQTLESGAWNSLWTAAGARKEELSNGSYYMPVGKVTAHPAASDLESAKQLWDWTEHEISKRGF